MPYALQYTTLTNKYVSFPALNIASGETFSVDCVASIDAAGAVRLVSSPSTVYTGRIWLQQSATPNIRVTTSEGVVADWNYSFVIGTFYKIRIVRTGTVGELFINDVSQGTRTLNGTFVFDRFFSQHTTFGSSCTVQYFEFVSNAGTRLYRNDSGTGTVWPDVNNPANNATQQGTWPTNDSEWIFYSSGGTTYTGGAATSYAIDTVGGGLALRLGGAVTTYAIDSTGGGTRTTSAGAPTSYALDSTGGGTRATSGGAVTTYALDSTGGGDVIKGATSYQGGAAVTFAAESTGGGVVIRAGGALLNFTAETTGGGTRTTSGGGSITVSLITVGGGDVIGPGYKPTITAPAVAVRRTYTGRGVRVVKTYRAPYTVKTQKTYRGATCRL